MKRVFSAICLAAGMAIGIAAQQPSATTSQETQGQRGPRSVTLTGCLRAGDTASTYMLTDVTGLPSRGAQGAMGSTVASGSTAAGTETGTSGSSSAGRSVTLTPAADVDLAPQVGHKIEVSGTMSRGPRNGAASGGTAAGNTGVTGGSTASGTAGSTSSTAAQGSNSRLPMVAVTSVHMIAESCS